MYVNINARAQAYTYVCARGLPAYFGILIARGRPSPLSLLTPFRRALRPVSPHLVPYRAPAPRLHPRIPVSSSPRVPLETLPIPKTVDSTRGNSSHMYFHVTVTIIYATRHIFFFYQSLSRYLLAAPSHRCNCLSSGFATHLDFSRLVTGIILILRSR